MELQRPTLDQLTSLCRRMEPSEVVEHRAVDFSFDPLLLARRLDASQFNGPSHVFVDAKGVPYYAAGFSLDRPHVASAWSVATPECAKHVVEMTRVSRAVIRTLLDNGVHRVSMACMVSRAPCRRWYEALGAKYEATLSKLGSGGEDFVIYAVLRESGHV